MFPNMNCRLHQAKIWDHLKSSEIISAPNPVLCPSCRYTPGAGRSPPIPGHRRSWAMPGPGPAAPSVTGTWPGPWCFQRFRNYGETMTMMKNHEKRGGWDYELSTSNLGIRTETYWDHLLYVCRWRDYRTICYPAPFSPLPGFPTFEPHLLAMFRLGPGFSQNPANVQTTLPHLPKLVCTW